MKTIKILLVLMTLLISSQTSYAQFLKKLGQRTEEAAKEAVIRKTEQKVNRETEKAMDTILDGKKGGKKKNKSSERRGDNNDGMNENDETLDQENTNGDFGVYSNFTFIPGNKLLFYDDFAADAIGDFPANWETGGSGEVVTTSDSESKWLSISRRAGYMPTMENKLPENYTIEFDLANNGYGSGKPISKLFFAFLTKKVYAMGEVEVKIGSRIDREMPDYLNSTVHISMAVNKKRLRMWVNEEKLVDSPNLLQVNIGNYFIVQAMDVLPEKGHFVGISNFKIAESTEDLRSLLLKNGKYSTTGIYFDTAAATIKKESYGILLDIANMLRDNNDITLQIVGHTDSQGKDDYNLTLSEDRAAAVKQFLVDEFGIQEDRLQFMGKGETEAVDDNSTEKGRANNRRVEFIKI